MLNVVTVVYYSNMELIQQSKIIFNVIFLSREHHPLISFHVANADGYHSESTPRQLGLTPTADIQQREKERERNREREGERKKERKKY